MQVIRPNRKDEPHFDLATLVENTARQLALSGLAHDRVRPPPTEEWKKSGEWGERILSCIPGKEEKHARNVALAIVHEIKSVLLPPPPAVMTIKRPPTYEELEARVKELEAAIEPIAEDMYRTGLHSPVNGVSDNADLFNLDPANYQKSQLKVGHLRKLYHLCTGRK